VIRLREQAEQETSPLRQGLDFLYEAISVAESSAQDDPEQQDVAEVLQIIRREIETITTDRSNQ